MARCPPVRHPTILHGLDMDAIIEVSDDESDAADSNQRTPPPSRPGRATRQRVNGEAPALYSAKYHPMDDVMRPAAAKRHHSEAFARDEDADDPEECMTDVGCIDEEDQEKFQPVRRKWSTGIRHSGRLDAPSRKAVDYNMKRHPQDAQLRLLEKSGNPNKRSKPSSFTYNVYHPELLEGDGKSSDEEEDDDDEPPSVGEAPIPTKRVAYSVQHSGGCRSVQAVIDDSDDKGSIDDDEDTDKENNPPTTRMSEINAGAEDDTVNAAIHFDDSQMVDMEDTPPPANMMDIEMDAVDNGRRSKADNTRSSSQNQMAERENCRLSSPTCVMEAETDTEDDEPSSRADNESTTSQNPMLEKGNPSPAARIATAEGGIEDDETGRSSKAGNVDASFLSADHHLTNEVEMDLPGPRSIPCATSVQKDDDQNDGEADSGSSALRSFLNSVTVAALTDGSPMIDAAEETLLASSSLQYTTAIQSVDRETGSNAEAQLLGPSLLANLPSSPSSKTDDEILGALLNITDKVLTSTQQQKVTDVDGIYETQAPSIRVSVLSLPPPTPEQEALFAHLAAPPPSQFHASEVERPASSLSPFARTASTPSSFVRAASTSSPSSRTASTPTPFSRTAPTPSSFMPGQVSASGEPIRGLFTPSHRSLAGAGSVNSFTFIGGGRPNTAPPDTGVGADNESTTATVTSSGANAFNPPRRLHNATGLFPILDPFSNLPWIYHPGVVFGAPSNPNPTQTETSTSKSGDADDFTEEEEEGEDDDDDDDEEDQDGAYPRYPLSELVRDGIRCSRRRSPSSRSSSIRSTNYPHGNPDLGPELPSIPEVNSGASPCAPRLNPLGLATTTEPDGVERRIPAGFDRYGLSGSTSVFPAPPLLPHISNKSSFSSGQPLSSPIAEIPRGARGISRPLGAPPPRRIPGSESIFVLPDAPFSSAGRHLDGEDYESPDEGDHWDKENLEDDEN